MKKLYIFIFLLNAVSLFGQTFNNEWIKYNQTYYKFKVGKNGLYRISKAALDAAGVNTNQVQNLELWRNGVKEPFYTSVNSGTLPANGYIEFWGKMNDGAADRPLYRDTANQHTQALNLIYDTATYFLSVNNDQSGFRFADRSNNVGANTLPAETNFNYTIGNYYKSQQNKGFAAIVGEYVYSSSYDKGEFWCSTNITPAAPLTTALSNLMVYAGGGNAMLKFGAFGNTLNARNVQVSVNNNLLVDTVLDYFNDVNFPVSFPASMISLGSAAVKFSNTSQVAADRLVISYFELTYPRTFDFGGASNFEFELPADQDGYYLEITNFNHGGVEPVLYDITNGNRYVGDISVAGKVRIVLPAAASSRKLVLASQAPSNPNSINSISSRVFTDYTQPSLQANYLIVTNPILSTAPNGRKPIDEYKAYRSSTNGGGYKVNVYDINELGDQFAYGMTKHPSAVRNLILFARSKFAQPIKNVFIIGRGMVYNEYRSKFTDTLADKLNLVPTFGNPGSDNLLSAGDLNDPIAITPIGRLSVVYPTEILDYLEKIIEYETVQRTAPQTVAGRAWMKNFVQVTGSTDPYLGSILCSYVSSYKAIIADTLMGGITYNFCKTTANPEEKMSSDKVSKLFEEGITALTYFGHSSATTLEFNIDNPQNYNNPGKYPVFFVNGCNAGNFFTYYTQRLLVNETLSEKFVLAKQRGSIAFVASSHYGIVNYLNIYLEKLFQNIGANHYGETLGEVLRYSLHDMVESTGSYDYYARSHAEQITLHGDPAIRFNQQPKPDYVVEESNIEIKPTFISVAEDSVLVKAKFYNLGKTSQDSVRVNIKRQYPNGSQELVFDKKIKNILFVDSVIINLPIVSTRDKGANRVIISIDTDQAIDETSESNNSVVKDFYIFEDELRPAFPYNFSIVNSTPLKLYASTADPFSPLMDYVMEIDTTELFNSNLKVSQTVKSKGGLVEFSPTITLKDSLTYYWRVAFVPNDGVSYRWNTASFTYMLGINEGFSQSHYFQHLYSSTNRIQLDSSRSWRFNSNSNTLFMRNAVYPTAADQQAAFVCSINDQNILGPGCNYNELIFNVIDPITMKPWKNDFSGSTGLYKSLRAVCGTQREYNFQYLFSDSASRKKAMDFMDSIPVGYYVLVRANAQYLSNASVFVNKWKDDTLRYGVNNSLYHKLLSVGFADLDKYSQPRTFMFVYKKGVPNFTPVSRFSDGIYDPISLSVNCPSVDTLGFITSPRLGPAQKWQQLLWNGKSIEANSLDNATIEVLGIDNQNIESSLAMVGKANSNFDISTIDATQYPFLKLKMRNEDTQQSTPYQLKKWSVLYTPVPEGAIAPNFSISMKDTFELGEPLNFAVCFKNIGKKQFDSLKVKLMVTNQNNVLSEIPLVKGRPIQTGDSIMIRFNLNTAAYKGSNTLYLDVNPDNDQQEQYHFNNFLYRKFFVKPDNINPLIDVTFDGVHILNKDVVSAKPHVQIKFQDEAKFMLLNDTSLVKVQLRLPNGVVKTIRVDNDTLRFTPASSGNNNVATLDYSPQFLSQLDPAGDDYELIVFAQDASGNKAGENEYRISFRIITKAMISNMLNYPNPFSNATSFVFTLTGSEIPQQLKIQILTVTGKIVKEITQDELGPLHIGRNITDYKWDGTDMFGQKLGNGVYLYRVVSNLNGKKLDRYKAEGDQTSQYFNNGYGKMYLMR